MVVERAEAPDTVLSSNELLIPSFHDKHSDALFFANQLYQNDVALWPRPDKHQVDYWALKSPSECLQLQNYDHGEKYFIEKSCPKTVGNEVRKCTSQMFYRTKKNGELVFRRCLCFSPTNGKLYCYACKILSSQRSQLTDEGFDDWFHASHRLAEHEKSRYPVESVMTLVRRAEELGKIDHELTVHVEQVAGYWRSVLKRVVSVISFISERGLAFRGSDEIIGSPNNGNFLGLLELISEYDDFLSQHIAKYGACGKGNVNYLSSTICEEVLSIMAQQVFKQIIQRINTSKYYCISLDSTPDEGHIDQLTLVFR